MNYIIQAFKALEDIDDNAVVVKVKPRKTLKESVIKESADDYYVLSDGKNPKNSKVYANIEDIDKFIADLEANKGDSYHELLHYLKGEPKKVWSSSEGKIEESCVKEDTGYDHYGSFGMKKFNGPALIMYNGGPRQIEVICKARNNRYVWKNKAGTPDSEWHKFASYDDALKVQKQVGGEIRSWNEYFGIKDDDIEESCDLKEEPKFDLAPDYDSRKSFYGKAKVDVRPDGTQVLYSYGTPVCKIQDGKATLLKRGYLGWASSATTLRHVKEFLRQNGFEAGSINDLRKNYPVEQFNEEVVKEEIDKNWKDFFSGKVIDDFGDYAIIDDNGTYLLWAKHWNRPLSRLGRNNEYIPVEFKNEKEVRDYYNQHYASKNESLQENHNVDLNDKKEVEEAKKEIEDESPTDEAERIIDVDAETIDKLKDSYLGQVILVCKKCRTPMFKAPEDVKKDEESEDTYNIEDECPHCGAQDGFELGGQIGNFDKVPEESAQDGASEQEEQPKEDEVEIEVKEKEERKVTPIENEKNESLLSKVENLDDEKFNTLVTKYLKEVYENVDSFETKDGTIEGDTVIVEGTIKYVDEKTKDVKFIFEDVAQTKGNKYRLTGINEDLTKDKNAFSTIATIKDDALVFETFSYNYKINLNEEETLVRGRTSLKESKKKEETKVEE